jgi:branched-chain amino acid transport system ATP-binding protein
LLRLEHIDALYGDVQVLYDLSMTVEEGEIVALVGPNGAGKSTTLRTISGLLTHRRGRIVFDGQAIDRIPSYRRVALGLVQVPEGRRLFPFMTVLENLELGCYTPQARAQKSQTFQLIFDLMPILQERRHQLASSLSGGEQQMCAIGRGLMARPKVLMLDEPTLGLAPMMVSTIFDTIKAVNAQGTTVVLVEQNVRQALNLAHRGVVLESGRVVLTGLSQSLQGDERLRKAYLGIKDRDQESGNANV